MNKRTFLGRLLGVGSAAAVAPLLTLVPTSSPTKPPDPEGVTWPCLGCGASTTTPSAVWPSVKLRLSCAHCGRRQPYLWHLKQFDPTPTEYRGSAGHPLATLRDERPAFETGMVYERSQASLEREVRDELAVIAAIHVPTPREREMERFRQKRMGKAKWIRRDRL